MKDRHPPTIPVEIGRINQRDIKITWQDGHESMYPARYLRLKCPCAGCVDEFTGQPLIAPEGVPDNIHPLKVELVGRYAVTIQWSDGHSTGNYAFDLLRTMCPCAQCVTGDK